MLTFAKQSFKEFFPRLTLQLRVKKLLSQRVDPDMYFLANLRRHLADSEETRRFAAYFTGEHSAIDVGACGGEYSCILARSFTKVLSIEPSPGLASKLRVSLPANCESVEYAVGKEHTEVNLRIPTLAESRLHALATVAGHDFAFSDVDQIVVAVVPQKTIDHLAGEHKLRPSFIKIDVEGYEAEVLYGCKHTIESCRPILLVEIEKRHNDQFREIFGYLDSLGYIPYHFREGQLQHSSPSVVEESYQCLVSRGVSGMADVIAARAAEHYINNFLFLPSE